jgi:arsenate reductase-like glutaredoxin family protein
MDAHGIEAREIVSASKKLGRAEAAELAKQAAKVIVAKGKSVQELAGGKAGQELVEAMLGPTGNLRAPALRVGKTLLIGFHEDAYREHLL